MQFFLDSNVVPLNLIGDGLLPAGHRRHAPGRRNDAPAPIVGTQDDDGRLRRDLRRLNIWELTVKWNAKPEASLTLAAQLPVAAFDSIFPCAPTSRDCLPQPGITNPSQYLDILSYRQRPTCRLAYRNFGTYEALVTNQSVEALPGRRGRALVRDPARRTARTRVYQQGTYAPDDGVHRWMGSVAQDRKGNIALGYSVVNGDGRLPGHPLHGPARRRSARADDSRRGHDHQRHGRADDHELPLGRLHLA